MQAAGDVKFSFDVSARVKDLLIEEGYDQRYGARHLKRAIERFLVYPMANLVSTGQVRYGDHLLLNIRKKDGMVEFHKESSPELRVVGESVQAPS